MEYVLITGATSGIGYALAQVFAAKGHPLILVGRSIEKLKKAKEALEQVMIRERKKLYPIALIAQNLNEDKAAEKIYEMVTNKKLRVSILINNAGIGYAGVFWEASDEKIIEQINVNMAQLTLLTKYFAKEMKEKGKGKILNVASTGAYHPGAYIGVYYATKAYVLSLSEALYEELKPYGVTVSSLCPGATRTGFQKISGREDTKLAMPPEFVARKAYKGLMKNKKIIVPGFRNQFMIKVPRAIGIQLIKHYQKATLSHK